MPAAGKIRSAFIGKKFPSFALNGTVIMSSHYVTKWTNGTAVYINLIMSWLKSCRCVKSLNATDKDSIHQTNHLLYVGYIFRTFIGSSSGLLWN